MQASPEWEGKTPEGSALLGETKSPSQSAACSSQPETLPEVFLSQVEKTSPASLCSLNPYFRRGNSRPHQTLDSCTLAGTLPLSLFSRHPDLSGQAALRYQAKQKGASRDDKGTAVNSERGV